MGGGGPSAPPDNSLEIERIRQEREDKSAAAAKIEAESQRARALTTARGNKASSYKTATSQLDDILGGAGLTNTSANYAPVRTKVMSQLDELYGGLGDDDPENIAKGLAGIDPKKVALDAVDADLGVMRKSNNDAVSKFYNDTLAGSMIQDTADDKYIDEALGDKYGQYATQLENAKKRGTIVGPGYEKALATLNTQREAGRATFQDVGLGILNEGREGFNKIGSRAKTDAGAANYGSGFNATTYQGELDNYFSGFNKDLGGRVKGAVAGIDPFDFGKVLTAGGIAQGPQATGTSGVDLISPQSVLAGGNDDGSNSANKKDKRGLGSQGAF